MGADQGLGGEDQGGEEFQRVIAANSVMSFPTARKGENSQQRIGLSKGTDCKKKKNISIHV